MPEANTRTTETTTIVNSNSDNRDHKNNHPRLDRSNNYKRIRVNNVKAQQNTPEIDRPGTYQY